MKKRTNLLLIIIVAIVLVCSFSMMACQAKNASDSGFDRDEAQGGASNSSASLSNLGAAPAGHKIIYTAFASIYTDNTAQTISQVKSMLKEDEWIDSESINKTSGSIVFRIKSTRIQEFLDGLSALGNLGDYSLRAEDISLTYADVESEISKNEALKAKVEALIPMATTLEEVLDLEDKLNDIENDLAELNSRKNRYDAQIEYSTVTVYFNQNYYKEDPTFANQTKTAIKDSWGSVGSFFKYLFLGFIYVFPYLLIFGGIAFVVIIIVRWKKGLPLFHKAPKQPKAEEDAKPKKVTKKAQPKIEEPKAEEPKDEQPKVEENK